MSTADRPPLERDPIKRLTDARWERPGSYARGVADGRAGVEAAVKALAELVALKDGPRGADYERRKPAAWDVARAVLASHGGASDAAVVQAVNAALTDYERIAISAVVHQNYYMPDVFAVVERIIAERGVTVTEWNVLSPNAGLTFGHHGTTKESARINVERSSRGRVLVSRSRTTFPDVTTEWRPADEEGGR